MTRIALKKLFTCSHKCGRVILTGFAVTPVLGLVQAKNTICVNCGTVLESRRILPLVVKFNKNGE